METMTEAIHRLRADGYDADMTAAPGGNLRCLSCGATHAPERAHIDEIVRFEGNSDPGDEAILLALRCDCGRSGLYSAAYGPDTATDDAELLRRLPST